MLDEGGEVRFEEERGGVPCVEVEVWVSLFRQYIPFISLVYLLTISRARSVVREITPTSSYEHPIEGSIYISQSRSSRDITADTNLTGVGNLVPDFGDVAARRAPQRVLDEEEPGHKLDDLGGDGRRQAVSALLLHPGAGIRLHARRQAHQVERRAEVD